MRHWPIRARIAFNHISLIFMLKITPENFGYAEITPNGDFEAGSYQSIEYLYTAGTYGIDDTGGIKIVFRLANDQSRIQLDDPQGPGYTTVEIPGHAEAEVTYDNRGHKRPWYKMLQVKLVKGNLKKNDVIRIRIGDRRFGSPGLRMQTFCQSEFEFRTFVDVFSNQNYLPIPGSPKIRIVPGEPTVWKAILPTLIQPDDTFRLCLKCEDKWGNPSDKMATTVFLRSNMPVINLPNQIEFTPGKATAILANLSLDCVGSLQITLQDKGGALLTVSNTMRVGNQTEYRQFWGDLHGQSHETVGTNSAREYFQFARDYAFLDMTGHQGNDFQITGAFWKHLDELTNEFHEPHSFLTLPGYEWSGNSGLGGDRNIYFLSEGATIYRSSHALVPDEPDEGTECYRADILFETLAKSPVPSAAFAHVGGRYANLSAGHDGRIEQSMEIHSAWGTFEWLLYEAFELGHRVGIVCHSDDHKGRPGAAYPGASLFGSYGGLTCYLMPELTRQSLFEAIQRRHHYGTTGARIYMDVRAQFKAGALLYERDPVWFDGDPVPVQDAIMGDIVQVTEDKIDISVEVDSAVPVERIELYDGTKLLETIRLFEPGELRNRIRVIWEGAEHKGRGRTVKWDGNIEIQDNGIQRYTPINFWNVEQVPEIKGGNNILWRSVTTGNFQGLDLWLNEPARGRLSFQSEQVSFELPVHEIEMDDRVFGAGGLSKRVRIFRLPDHIDGQRCHIARQVGIKPEGDTRIYAKVILEDGHIGWSSPIYLFRGAPHRE